MGSISILLGVKDTNQEASTIVGWFLWWWELGRRSTLVVDSCLWGGRIWGKEGVHTQGGVRVFI